ncbi:RluA family pseudouridine synthase [Butyrivibrio sp. YAB3001]|uniref:RluA family pseudouridine synthase n=1 Tax=Butyrivibrio sp. YAB3001 TaxID=1520812 RepID=UPI0008F6291D|nr:RluA family pseudouridine synthase [Butyrivibrio sp. YAB3001]SFB67541.1 23S rRNA pseudouridine955/2504/2580 synthase [Butyrivibrio sp. YAB3001]
MKEIVIGKNEENKRLDSFLKSYLPNASSGFLYKMLRKKSITLNDKKADGKEKLSKGDSIKIFFSDETFDKFHGKQSSHSVEEGNFKALKALGPLEIIYEDSNILLVNKPAGVLSQKSKPSDISLNDWLIDYLVKKGDISTDELGTFKPSICNRLDRNTSGIVICAKSLLGARTMSELLKDRTVDKYYRTIVSGKIGKSSKLSGFLFKDEKKNKVFISQEDPHDTRYSYIETEFVPLEYSSKNNLTLLEVKLITGKPHQIRAHLADQKTPIIGDVKYGGKVIAGQNFQLLHCYRVRFPKEMSIEFSDIAGKEYIAECPEIFDKIFRRG